MAFPKILSLILLDYQDNGSGVIAGFLSTMVGLGFYWAKDIDSKDLQLKFINISIWTNIVNASGHIINVVSGKSPYYLLLMISVAIGGFIASLLYVKRKINT